MHARAVTAGIVACGAVLAATRAKYGRDHPFVADGLGNWAKTLEADGQLGAAADARGEMVAVRRRRPADADTPAADTALDLASDLAPHGFLLLRAGRPAEAEPVLRECLALRQANAPDAWTTFNARAMVGAALLGQKQYKAADALLRDGYAGMRARVTDIPSGGLRRLSEAAARLADVAAALGDTAEASRWAAESRREFGPPPREVSKPVTP